MYAALQLNIADVGGRFCTRVQKSQEHSFEEFLHYLTTFSECYVCLIV